MIVMGDDILGFYDDMANAMPPICRCAEIGVWEGRTVLHLAHRLQDLGRTFSIVAIDLYDGGPSATPEMKAHVASKGGSLLPAFVKAIAAARFEFMDSIGGVIIPVRADSLKAARRYYDEFFDLVFLDSSHEYDATKAEITAWLPKVKPGGTLAGHDFGPAPGVTAAVRESFHSFGLHGSCWFITKE